MKKTITQLLVFFLTSNLAIAQYPEGQVVVKKLYSGLLENPGGEDPTRRVTIYLPPGYDESDTKYPVIYYLHGFTWSDSLMISVDNFDKLMDQAISTHKIRPSIVVMPDNHTLYRGSFYTNSTLTGKWADFTATELVSYVDSNFRTISKKESRGIAGHSMGGHGAIKISMLYPEVFSSVYMLSPAVLGFYADYGPSGSGYKRGYHRLQEITTRDELVGGKDFDANALIAIGRAFSPNPRKPPFYADLPFSFINDSLIVHNETLRLWHNNSPIEMLDIYGDNLRELRAIKLDWGRNEWWTYLPITAKQFSLKLESLGIHHYAEEYIGDHGNKLWTNDGRALNDMLPFFDTYLRFE